MFIIGGRMAAIAFPIELYTFPPASLSLSHTHTSINSMQWHDEVALLGDDLTLAKWTFLSLIFLWPTWLLASILYSIHYLLELETEYYHLDVGPDCFVYQWIWFVHICESITIGIHRWLLPSIVLLLVVSFYYVYNTLSRWFVRCACVCVCVVGSFVRSLPHYPRPDWTRSLECCKEKQWN